MSFIGSIELSKLENVQYVKLQGKTGVFIPLDDNPCLRPSKNSRCFLNLMVRESKNNAYGNSHMIIAQVTNKELKESLGDSLRDKQPIIGNLKPDQFSDGSRNFDAPSVSPVDDDDLPM